MPWVKAHPAWWYHLPSIIVITSPVQNPKFLRSHFWGHPPLYNKISKLSNKVSLWQVSVQCTTCNISTRCSSHPWGKSEARYKNDGNFVGKCSTCCSWNTCGLAVCVTFILVMSSLPNCKSSSGLVWLVLVSLTSCCSVVQCLARVEVLCILLSLVFSLTYNYN